MTKNYWHKTDIFSNSVKITIGSFNALAMAKGMALPRPVAKCPLFKNNFASVSKIRSSVRKCWYKFGWEKLTLYAHNSLLKCHPVKLNFLDLKKL